MKQLIVMKPCTVVYLLLMALTLITWFTSVSGFSGLTFTFLVLSLSLLKGILIGDYYMGLNRVCGAWRWVIICWLLLPGSLIAYAFYIAPSIKG